MGFIQRFNYFFCRLSVVWLATMALCAAKTLVITEPSFSFAVAPYTEYVLDSKLEIDSLLMDREHIDFQASNTSHLQFGYQPETLWLRFWIKSQLPQTSIVHLIINYPILDHIQLYEIRNNTVQNRQIRGDHYPPIERNLQVRPHVFNLTLPENSLTQVVLAIRSTSSLNVPLQLSSNDQLIANLTFNEMLEGVFYGLMIAFLLYSIGIFLITRHNIYLLHASINLCYLGFNFSLDGLFYLLFPNADIWLSYSIYFFMAISFAFAVHFTRHYFDTRHTNPKIDTILKTYSFTAFVIAFTLFITPLHAAPKLAAATLLIGAACVLSFGFYFLKNLSKPAIFFIAAWGLFVASGAIATLSALDVLPIQAWLNSMVKLSMMCNIFILSLGIGFNFNQLNNELNSVGAMRKIANKRLELLNQDLDNRVKQRTVELIETNKVLSTTLEKLKSTQNHLVESNKMAALGQLVSGVAHEINTPIGIILTATSYLSSENQAIKDMLETNQLKKSTLQAKIANMNESIIMIENNIRRTSDLIHVFKETSIESYGFNVTRINLYDFLSQLFDIYKKRFDDENINFSLDCLPSVHLYSDQNYLEKIFNYFIENTLMHAFQIGSKNKRIDVTVKEHCNDVIIEYRDNGIGISPEDMEKIFNPFFTTKRSEGCKGLGLSVIFNLVNHALKGQIEHIPAEEGALFRITLSQNLPETI